jgi:hypothetical protein
MKIGRTNERKGRGDPNTGKKGIKERKKGE